MLKYKDIYYVVMTSWGFAYHTLTNVKNIRNPLCMYDIIEVRKSQPEHMSKT